MYNATMDLAITEEQIQQHKSSLSIIAIVTVVINLVGMAVILRCPFSVIGSYKWHLLNVAVWACLMDLHFALVFTPFPLFPIIGFCTFGIFSAYGRVAEIANFIISMELYGLYGLALVNAILYHMTKIVGAKSFLKSKRALTVAILIQVFYAAPVCVFQVFVAPSNDAFLEHIREKAPSLEGFIREHACSGVIPSPVVYAYIILGGVLVFLSALTVFVCCALAVLLLLRNKGSQSSANYMMFRSMTIGLISQLTFPMLTLMIPPMWIYIKLYTTDSNPADYTPVAMQALSSHSAVNIIVMLLTTRPLRHSVRRVLPFGQQTDNGPRELFERRLPSAAQRRPSSMHRY